jgi:hypothetical protein
MGAYVSICVHAARLNQPRRLQHFIAGSLVLAGTFSHGPLNEAGGACNHASSNAYTLEEAQNLCLADASCQWIHDFNCDNSLWRVCGGLSAMLVGDGSACTMTKGTCFAMLEPQS